MSKSKETTVKERISNAIKDIKAHDGVVNFFVLDTKDLVNGEMAYIYDLAYTLHEQGVKVQMLYQIKDEVSLDKYAELINKGADKYTIPYFIGVRSWLGDKYADLPHLNIADKQWSVSPQDYLIIPEAFAEMMYHTFKNPLPCKRYALLHNFNYITEFLPFGTTWLHYGIFDAIVSSPSQEKLLKSVFPKVNTIVLPPSIPDYFRKGVEPKKLVVNIITKTTAEARRIIQQFYWKYPVYKFVTFRDLRNLPREDYANAMREGCITVWSDPTTAFGYGALEAMKSGSIVIGKIPDDIPDWMGDNTHLVDNGIWVDNINQIPDWIAKTLGVWMNDNVPQELYSEAQKTVENYTPVKWKENVAKLYDKMCSNRVAELEELIEKK